MHSMDYVLTALSSFYDVRYQRSKVRVRVSTFYLNDATAIEAGRQDAPLWLR